MNTATTHTSRTFAPGTVRWLSAAGHPGYGRKFAAQVAERMVAAGEDLNDLRLVSAWAFNTKR